MWPFRIKILVILNHIEFQDRFMASGNAQVSICLDAPWCVATPAQQSPPIPSRVYKKSSRPSYPHVHSFLSAPAPHLRTTCRRKVPWQDALSSPLPPQHEAPALTSLPRFRSLHTLLLSARHPVAEPSNLMPLRSARLSLDTNHSRENTKLRSFVGTPQGRTRKSTFFHQDHK